MLKNILLMKKLIRQPLIYAIFVQKNSQNKKKWFEITIWYRKQYSTLLLCLEPYGKQKSKHILVAFYAIIYCLPV